MATHRIHGPYKCPSSPFRSSAFGISTLFVALFVVWASWKIVQVHRYNPYLAEAIFFPLTLPLAAWAYSVYALTVTRRLAEGLGEVFMPRELLNFQSLHQNTGGFFAISVFSFIHLLLACIPAGPPPFGK